MPKYEVSRAGCSESVTLFAICPQIAAIEFLHDEVSEGCIPPQEVLVKWSSGEETYEFKKKEQQCPSRKPQRSILQKLFGKR